MNLKKSHLQFLLVLAAVITCGIVFDTSRYLTANFFATDPESAAKCLSMDLTNDARVTATDTLAMRNYMLDTSMPKYCVGFANIPAPSDPAILAKCNLMDLSNDGRVNVTDELMLRTYMSDSTTTKICTIRSSSSSSVTCTNTSKVLYTEASKQIDDRIAGIVATELTEHLFKVRGNSTAAWQRNTDVWTSRGTKALDLTGASPWNSDYNYKKAGTLISPRHIVYAQHYKIASGTTILFVDKNNAIVTRKLVDQRRIGISDMRVGVLDANVPSSITFYPMLSLEQLNARIPSLQGLPILALDQDDHALIKDVYFVSPANNLSYIASVNAARKAYDESLIVGDSGNPTFLVVNDKLVLLTTHEGTTSGPYYGAAITQINQAMTELGGGYQVTPVDLSCF